MLRTCKSVKMGKSVKFMDNMKYMKFLRIYKSMNMDRFMKFMKMMEFMKACGKTHGNEEIHEMPENMKFMKSLKQINIHAYEENHEIL